MLKPFPSERVSRRPIGKAVGNVKNDAANLIERITTQDYDKKARELKQQQTEIGLRIEHHQKGNDDYRITLECLFRWLPVELSFSRVRKPRKSGNSSL